MIRVHDKDFRLYMSEAEIAKMVSRMAAEISRDLKGQDPLFVVTLTGAYIFASDLVRQLDFDAEVCFVKYSSYSGMESTRKVRAALPFAEQCRGRQVVLVEDIVDTGITMDYMLKELAQMQPAGVKIASLLFKPDCFQRDFKIDYLGCSIPSDFIVGYGMDYDNKGRSYRDIYVLADAKESERKEK